MLDHVENRCTLTICGNMCKCAVGLLFYLLPFMIVECKAKIN